MKQYGYIYKDFTKMISFIQSKSIHKSDNVLIQVYTGVVDIEFINKIVNEIASILPQAEIIGSTTAGEIYNGMSLINTTIMSFTIFQKVKIKATLLNNNSKEYELGIRLVKDLVEKDTKLIILFSDGLLTNAYDIIKGIESSNSNVIVCGGKAADNGYLKETFVFTKEGVTNNGIAAISLTGKQLNVTTERSLGWSTIGKQMTVTKASANRIYTIDNVTAFDIYKKYLGDDIAKDLPMSATEFPLIHIKNGIHIARVASNCYEDGSLSFLGNVEVNDKVQFGYGNVSWITAKALEITNKLQNKNIEAIFVYSCSVRKSFMQDEINLEISPLNSIAPTFGFFTYGEFFSSNSSNELLNITMTLVGLSESEHPFQKNEITLTKYENSSKSFLKGNDLGVIKVFTNLVNQTTKELLETNKILEDQKYKLEQMNNITKAILQINSEMLSSSEFDKFLQMILDKSLDIIPKGKMGSILLLENNRLCYNATKGYIVNRIKDITYKLEDTYQYRTNPFEELFNPIIIKDVQNQLFPGVDQNRSWNAMLCEPPRELLTCGIDIDGQLMGFINIFNTNEDGNFNEDDKNLLKYLCYDIAIALKNSHLLENILYMSRYDNLTELYNRRYFMEIFYKTLNKAKFSNEIFVICMIDLNNLKTINDAYGHDAGDEVLREFASIFKMGIGKNDVFGRIGGDEFTVIFINKNKNQVNDIIIKICVLLKKEISFAYGLAQFNCDSNDFDELLRIADRQMYEKKRLMKQCSV